MTLAAAGLSGTAPARAEDLPEELRSTEVRSMNGVVVANTHEAAAAGARILQQGGNAVDAAVATALALGVSEAEASGIGGNAWILIHLASGRDIAIDGSGAVPLRVNAAELQSQLDDGFDSATGRWPRRGASQRWGTHSSGTAPGASPRWLHRR